MVCDVTALDGKLLSVVAKELRLSVAPDVKLERLDKTSEVIGNYIITLKNY